MKKILQLYLIVEWYRKYKLKHRWYKISKILQDDTISLLDRCISTNGLFDNLVNPDLSLTHCSQYYITPHSHNLFSLLFELENHVKEYKKNCVFHTSVDKWLPTPIRLDQWIYSDGHMKIYKNIDLLDSWIRCNLLINEIYIFVKNTDKVQYAERKCFKQFNTYLLLTDLLWTMINKNKSKEVINVIK